MNLLEVKNICKTYGSGETAVKALRNVSFSVPKGEYVAIVGESGSGDYVKIRLRSQIPYKIRAHANLVFFLLYHKR